MSGPRNSVTTAPGSNADQRDARIAEWRSRLLGAVRIEDRLRLLREIGLTDEDIARALPKGNARSVRRWRTEGVARVRMPGRWEPIDDLCVIVGFLLADGTYDEDGVVAWLRSRQIELDHARPLEALGAGAFVAVHEAAERTRAPSSVQPVQTDGPLAQAFAVRQA